MGRSDDVTRPASSLADGSLSARPRSGCAGRAGGTVFFLIWLAIPVVILGFIARETWRDAQTWRWPAADCTILRSGVESADSGDNYVFRVEYRYDAKAGAGDVEARPYTATVYARGYRGSTDYADAQRLVLSYPAGARATCYVNPANPSDAVLKRNGLTTGAMVLFPLFFILIGLAGLWFTWRGDTGRWGSGSISRGASTSTSTSTSASISKGATSRNSFHWGLVLFFAMFGGCGLVVFFAMGAGTLRAFTARSWRAVPATVESSRVRSHHGDSTTYSVDILYRFAVDGREYKSNRYSFMGGSSSGYEGKRQIVARLRPGTRTVAYVNPADPTDAVLVRGFTWDMLFLLIPLVFVAIGVGGGVYGARRVMRARLEEQFVFGGGGGDRKIAGRSTPRDPAAGREIRRYTPRSSVNADAGPLALKPRISPLAKLIGITVFALIWNGIVSIFVYQAVTSWMRGRGEVCLTIFMVPFVGVGLAVIGAAFHSLLALFNPRVVLVLGRGELAVGESADLRWSVAGRTDRIHRLVLRLEGREEATYRRGTSTYTDKNTFFSADLLDTEDAAEIREGRSQVQVPPDTMHSFNAANNKIVWALAVHGHIRGWPDVKDEYAVTVAPRLKQSSAAAPDEPEQPETSWNA